MRPWKVTLQSCRDSLGFPPFFFFFTGQWRFQAFSCSSQRCNTALPELFACRPTLFQRGHKLNGASNLQTRQAQTLALGFPLHLAPSPRTASEYSSQSCNLHGAGRVSVWMGAAGFGALFSPCFFSLLVAWSGERKRVWLLICPPKEPRAQIPKCCLNKELLLLFTFRDITYFDSWCFPSLRQFQGALNRVRFGVSICRTVFLAVMHPALYGASHGVANDPCLAKREAAGIGLQLDPTTGVISGGCCTCRCGGEFRSSHLFRAAFCQGMLGLEQLFAKIKMDFPY